MGKLKKLSLSERSSRALSQRGRIAQQKLVQAGIDLFGRYGYDGVTTRALIRRAGVNISTLHYHFEGKEGLYGAVIRHIGDIFNSKVSRQCERAVFAAQDGRLTREVLLKHLLTLADELVITLLRKEFFRFSRVVIHEQIIPTGAYQRLFENSLRPVYAAFGSLIAKLTGANPGSRAVILETHAVIGQILVYLISREALFHMLKSDSYNKKILDEIRKTIRRLLFRIYGGR